MKLRTIGLILVMLLIIPIAAMAVNQNIPVTGEIPAEFSCSITDEYAQAAGWYPVWALPPATTTTTLWGRITGFSNFDWQVSADMGPVGWLVNDGNPGIHLNDNLKIVMETWPESNVDVDGWVHSEPDVNAYTPFDNDYSLRQAVANEPPGTYSGTITFTCVNMIDGGTCGNGVMEGAEECDDGNTSNRDGCSPTCIRK
jgi:cysteine-rich repeat protein